MEEKSSSLRTLTPDEKEGRVDDRLTLEEQIIVANLWALCFHNSDIGPYLQKVRDRQQSKSFQCLLEETLRQIGETRKEVIHGVKPVCRADQEPDCEPGKDSVLTFLQRHGRTFATSVVFFKGHLLLSASDCHLARKLLNKPTVSIWPKHIIHRFRTVRFGEQISVIPWTNEMRRFSDALNYLENMMNKGHSTCKKRVITITQPEQQIWRNPHYILDIHVRNTQASEIESFFSLKHRNDSFVMDTKSNPISSPATASSSSQAPSSSSSSSQSPSSSSSSSSEPAPTPSSSSSSSQAPSSSSSEPAPAPSSSSSEPAPEPEPSLAPASLSFK